MKSSGIKTSTVLASFLLAACLSMHAEVKLPAIFSDGMVMQQQTNANLWGTATPNKKVTVTTKTAHGNFQSPLRKPADRIPSLSTMEPQRH